MEWSYNMDNYHHTDKNPQNKKGPLSGLNQGSWLYRAYFAIKCPAKYLKVDIVDTHDHTDE